jgi:hypothetical protein
MFELIAAFLPSLPCDEHTHTQKRTSMGGIGGPVRTLVRCHLSEIITCAGNIMEEELSDSTESSFRIVYQKSVHFSNNGSQRHCLMVTYLNIVQHRRIASPHHATKR